MPLGVDIKGETIATHIPCDDFESVSDEHNSLIN